MALFSQEFYVKDRLAIAITSMVRSGSFLYLGLTSGQRSLIAYDLETGKFHPLPAVFPWVKDRGYCTKIHNALGVLADGSLLLGEGNHFTWDGIPVTCAYFDQELPEFMLARKQAQGFPDVKYSDFCLENLNAWNRRRDNPGGKIVRFDPSSGDSSVLASLPPYLYVQSMIVDSERNQAYGHTIPDNHFFHLNLNNGKLTDHGRISDYAFHNLAIAPNGICYGAWVDKADSQLKLLRFDPNKERLDHLETPILSNIGPKVAGNQGIDQWITTRDGSMYVGTVADASLLRFDWERETFSLVFAKLAEARVTSLDEDDDGMIWIGAGYPHMQLIRFHPGDNSMLNFGRVNQSYPRCYFHAACCYQNKLFLGETDGFSPSLHVVDLQPLRRNITCPQPAAREMLLQQSH